MNEDTQTQDLLRGLISAATADLHVPARFAAQLLRRRRRARIVRAAVPLTMVAAVIALVTSLTGTGTRDHSQIIPAQPVPAPSCTPTETAIQVPKQTPNGPLSNALAGRLTRKLPGYRVTSASEVTSACDATVNLTNTAGDSIVVSVRALTRPFDATAYSAANDYQLKTLADRSQLLVSDASQAKGVGASKVAIRIDPGAATMTTVSDFATTGHDTALSDDQVSALTGGLTAVLASRGDAVPSTPTAARPLVGTPVVDRISLPTGWTLLDQTQGPLPTGTSAKITDHDIRYAASAGPQAGEIEVDLQTGDVTTPTLASLKGIETAPKYAAINRPSATSPIIIERDAASEGGLTIYEWMEGPIYVQIIASGTTGPLSPLIASLKVAVQ
jgi:hypothetical protein